MNSKRPTREGNPHALKVLMYHRVVDDERLSASHWSCVHERDFRSHLEFLDRWGYTTITFDDYRLFLRGEANLPRKPVILTFDDGYLDTYTCAYPLLHEFGMNAVMFVLGDHRIRSNFWDTTPGMYAPLMAREQLLELHEAGFEIGSHSLSHADLSILPENSAWEQISRSGILLEMLLNAPVRSFAYPYGLLAPRVKQMITEAGYDIACGVWTGPAAFGVDPFEIRRIPILNTTGTADFAIRLLTPFQLYAWSRWNVRKLVDRVSGNGTRHAAAAGEPVHVQQTLD